MRCAVTGANGFIGTVLTGALRDRGWTVRALSRRPPSAPSDHDLIWYRGDLRTMSGDALRTFLQDVDILFHCAGVIDDETVMEELHVGATARLLEVASGRIRRWVQLSSCGVYGPVRKGVVTEESPLRPEGVYEETKLRSEQIVTEAAATGPLSAVVLRPANVYGDGMPNSSLRSWVRSVERGLFSYVGPPGAMTSYVHVDDVAEALCLLAEADEAGGRAYNLSCSCPIEEFVEAMCAGLGRGALRFRMPEFAARMLASAGRMIPGFPLTHSRVDALTVRACYSSARIRDELGFEPRIDPRKGLDHLIRSMKNE